MITREELGEYAKTRNLNLGQAEKDYFQNIILFILYQEHGRDLVFKGGTALNKCYGLNRFSEDLDFTCEEDFDTEKIERGLKRFRIEFESDTKKHEEGLKTILRLKGPLFFGPRQSLCKVAIDVSQREKTVLEPEIKSIGRFMEEIPAFDVMAMPEKEILAEKARAIMTRTKARDAYDFWFLTGKGVRLDRKLAGEKLKYYGLKWSEKEFRKKLGQTRSIWETELKPLIRNVPDFRETVRSITSAMRTRRPE